MVCSYFSVILSTASEIASRGRTGSLGAAPSVFHGPGMPVSCSAAARPDERHPHEAGGQSGSRSGFMITTVAPGGLPGLPHIATARYMRPQHQAAATSQKRPWVVLANVATGVQ